MPTAATNPKSKFATLADVLARVGDVPPERIRAFPAPGTATEADLLDSDITGDRGHELVDGILVEKAMGFRADLIGFWLGVAIAEFLKEHNIGTLSGAQGLIRFRPGQVRVPDVAFIRWDSVADTDEIEEPDGAFLEVAPDFVVEVLSPGNTRKEMEIKLSEYAKAGVKLVWYVDPERKEVDVYPKAKARGKKTVGVGGTLDGGAVLPGFTLPVAQIFAKRAPAKKPGKK